MKVTTYEVTISEHPPQFEIHAEDDKAYLTFSHKDGALVLVHTSVPNALRGKNIAAELSKFAFAYAKEKGLPVVVLCPFVAAYLRKHPELEPQIKK